MSCGKVFVLLVGFLLMAGFTHAQRLHWIDTLGGTHSFAFGISADGSTAVGQAYTSGGQAHAFRWTGAAGIQDLGTLGGNESTAQGVSASGVVVGSAFNAQGKRLAFRWDPSTGMVSLGTLGGDNSYAYGVTPDGSAVAGWASMPSNTTHAFVWRSSTGSLQDLGTLGGSNSFAYAISADGRVVVGESQSIEGWRAFRWDETTGMYSLGTLGGNSKALAVSADGNVIAGGSGVPSGQIHAFRWTAGEGMQDLGTLGGDTSWAMAVSGNGTVVVGEDSSLQRAFIWTPGSGMQDLNALYASLLTNGEVLSAATAISADGRVIAGWGYHPSGGFYRAFVLETVPEPGSGLAAGTGLLLLLAQRWRVKRR